jgi:succinate dehydrogenase / fumarate reductase cytochrome b subunit
MASTALADTLSKAGVIGRFTGSLIGAKILMAVTGFGLVGFVVMHMVANLQIFIPWGTFDAAACAGTMSDACRGEILRHPINDYAHKLESLGALLWVARLGLLAMLGVHVWAAIKTTGVRKEARGQGYDKEHTWVASLQSRTMMLTGLVILAYLAYHLAHFTFGAVDSAAYQTFRDAGDVYNMVIFGFKQPLVVAIYVVANALIAAHLSHAVSSIFQTVGLRTRRYAAWIDKAGPAVGAFVLAGNLAMPIGVLLGLADFGGPLAVEVSKLAG